MEPLTAVGLAANIVQFVTFGINIVSKGNQIYRSQDGDLPKNREIENVTKDLQQLQGKLRSSIGPHDLSNTMTEDDQALKALLDTSNDIATQLLQQLNRVKAKGRPQRWKSLRQALKSVCSKGDIESLAQRLSALREGIKTRIFISLR